MKGQIVLVLLRECYQLRWIALHACPAQDNGLFQEPVVQSRGKALVHVITNISQDQTVPTRGEGPAHWSGCGHILEQSFPHKEKQWRGRWISIEIRESKRTHWMGLYLRLGLRVTISQASWYHLCTEHRAAVSGYRPFWCWAYQNLTISGLQ